MNQHYQPPTDFADESWKRARRQVLYKKVVCAITHCSVDMRSFEEVRSRLHLTQSHYRGLLEIPLANIQGSVSRYDDFTATFMPRKEHMRERWKKVYELVGQRKAPPIEAYQVEEAFFVVDGNHRVSAARQHGFDTIAAYVTAFETPQGFNPQDGIEDFMIKNEKQDFLNQVGDPGTSPAAEIQFTCVGCYGDLKGQIETYREGVKIKTGKTVAFDEAFQAWHSEIYTPAIESIRQDKLADLFPNRTEADLFIWSWQNSTMLEQETEDQTE